MTTEAEAPAAPHRRIQDWADWAIRLMVPALVSAAVAGIYWSANTENRVANVEKFEVRLAKLESREDGYNELTTGLAVLQAKMDARDKQLDRIEKLLELTR